MAYNQYLLPSGSYENDQLFKTDNIYLILRYIASMYSGSEYELRYLAPFRSTDKFTVGQLSPSSSLSGSVEHNLSSSILFRLLGPSGSGVVHQQLTVGNYILDPTASLRIEGLVRIMGGAPFSGAILSSISSDGLAEWINPSILTTNGSGSSGTTSPAIPTNSVQYNNNNTFGGSVFFTYNSSSHHLNVSGAVSSSYGANTVGFFGTSSWAVSSSKSISSSYADTSSYVTTLRASDPTQSIQFNDTGLLTGSNLFTFNRTNLLLTSSFLVLGSQSIYTTSSFPALTLYSQQVTSSVLASSYLLPYTDRYTQLFFVPSSSIESYGQIWVTSYGPAPVHIFDIMSQSGELRFRGRIGGSSTSGRLASYGTYIERLDCVLVLDGEFSGPRVKNLIIYSPATIGVQSLGFTASIDSAYELSLMGYSCSLRENNTGSGINDLSFFLSNHPIAETSQHIIAVGYSTSSTGDATDTLLNATPLSASIASLSSSNSNIA